MKQGQISTVSISDMTGTQAPSAGSNGHLGSLALHSDLAALANLVNALEISGSHGFSGFSGISGAMGSSGFSGFSGMPGAFTASGFSGFSGTNGTVGSNGASGFSGFSGTNGTVGSNGASGFSGFSGFSGISGATGSSGFSGFSGSNFSLSGLTSGQMIIATGPTTIAGTTAVVDLSGNTVLIGGIVGYSGDNGEVLQVNGNVSAKEVIVGVYDSVNGWMEYAKLSSTDGSIKFSSDVDNPYTHVNGIGYKTNNNVNTDDMIFWTYVGGDSTKRERFRLQNTGNILIAPGTSLITTASTSISAGFNLPHGTAPTNPINGDMWSTSAGFFGRVSGQTVGPFSVGGSGADGVSSLNGLEGGLNIVAGAGITVSASGSNITITSTGGGSSPTSGNIILDGWNSSTTVVSATTTAPTKGTVVNDTLYWRQVGDTMECRLDYYQSGGGSNGTGSYQWLIPGGLHADTSKCSIDSIIASPMSSLGTGFISNGTNSDSSETLAVVLANSTNIGLTSVKSLNSIGSTYGGFGGSLIYTANFSIPILEWANNVGSASSSLPQFMECALDSALMSITVESGSYTLGHVFLSLAALTCTGVQVYWAGSATTLDIILWDNTGTNIANGTITVTSTPGMFRGYFGTPITLTSNARYIVSYCDTAGSPQYMGSLPTLMPPYSYSPPGYVSVTFLSATGTNNYPTTGSASNAWLLDPIFS